MTDLFRCITPLVSSTHRQSSVVGDLRWHLMILSGPIEGEFSCEGIVEGVAPEGRPSEFRMRRHEWEQLTGLPFIFPVWVGSRVKEYAREFVVSSIKGNLRDG